MELLSDLGHFPKHKVEGGTGCKTLIISRLKKGYEYECRSLHSLSCAVSLAVAMCWFWFSIFVGQSAKVGALMVLTSIIFAWKMSPWGRGFWGKPLLISWPQSISWPLPLGRPWNLHGFVLVLLKVVSEILWGNKCIDEVGIGRVWSRFCSKFFFQNYWSVAKCVHGKWWGHLRLPWGCVVAPYQKWIRRKSDRAQTREHWGSATRKYLLIEQGRLLQGSALS